MIERFELRQNGHKFEAHNVQGGDINHINYIVDVEFLQTELKVSHYKLTLYVYGAKQDILIGGWKFFAEAKGKYDGCNYCSTDGKNRMSVTISAISPYGEQIELSYSICANNESYYLAECFLNGLYLISCCNCAKEYYDTKSALDSGIFVNSDNTIKSNSEILLSFANTIKKVQKDKNKEQLNLRNWLTEKYLHQSSVFFEGLLDFERRKEQKVSL